MARLQQILELGLLLLCIAVLFSPRILAGDYKPVMCGDCTESLCKAQTDNRQFEICCKKDPAASFPDRVCKCCRISCTYVTSPKGPAQCSVMCKGPNGHKAGHIGDTNCTKA